MDITAEELDRVRHALVASALENASYEDLHKIASTYLYEGYLQKPVEDLLIEAMFYQIDYETND